nr:MAG TPA: hypothetical protein [Caudoviricetes sp.]
MSAGLLTAQKNLTGLNRAASSTSSIFKGVTMQAAGLTAALTGLYGVSEAVGNLIKAPYEFAKNMETNQIGISGILQSMTKLDGKTLEWNTAMRISGGILHDLNDAALRTAATSEDLIEAFRALLGPGLAAGMNIEQLKEFTTIGVNAVKSMGLPRNQIVQELRDLVQGGIRPQSSTLATSLGLTDADIKAAKESSEGLYAFLMKRMEGFKAAALATPKTMAGLMDQIKEGYTRTAADGTAEIYSYYKELLGKVANLFLDQETFKLDEDLVKNVSAFSTHVVNAARGLENVGSAGWTVIGPALETAGTAAGVLADNTELIVKGFAAWKLGGIVLDLGNVVTQTNNAYQAQTLLGTAVQKVSGYWNTNKIAAQGAYQQEIQAAENAAAVINQTERQKQASIKNTEVVTKAVLVASKQQNFELSADLRLVAQHYQNLGVSAQKAGQLQLQAAKVAAKGQLDLARQILDTQEKHILAANAALDHGKKLQGLQNKAMLLGGTLTGLGVTVQMLSGDTDSFSYKLAGTAVNAGIAIGAIGTLIGWLGKLALAYKEVAIMGAAAGLLSGAGIVGAVAIGTGLVTGGAAVGLYAGINDLDAEELNNRYTGINPRTKKRQEATKRFIVEQAALDKQKEIDDARKAAEEASRLALNSFGGSDDKGKKAKGGKSEAEKQAEKALKELTKWQGKVNELAEDLQTKITEQTGSKLDIATASLTAELEKMNSTIENAKVAGVDNEALKSVQAQIDLYKKLKEEQNNRDWITEQHKLRMDNLQAEEDSQTRHISVINEMRALELERYKEKLQEELAATNLTEQEKLRLRQEFAAATQELQEAQATDLKASWDNALEYIKNKQFNQFETIKGGFDDILSTMSNFGQNMITEQKSFSEMADSLFKDLANSIMNTMMKVIMQGLVMNSIMSMFGMGGGGGFDLGGILNNPSRFSVGGTSYAGGSFMGKFAQGGYTGRGWALVGEEGPELLDLKTPGRVYTADQTRAALSGSAAGGTTKIIVQLENKSGTQLKASEQNTTFDGKNYVVSVLLEAVTTNYMGTQNILRGALGTP